MGSNPLFEIPDALHAGDDGEFLTALGMTTAHRHPQRAARRGSPQAYSIYKPLK